MSSKGVLFFVYDNGLVDYSALARFNTENVKKYLGCEVCLVSNNRGLDVEGVRFVYDEAPAASLHRNFNDFEDSAPWYNTSRVRALDLTPFDQTVVLDVDYLVLSSALKPLLNIELGVANRIRLLDEYVVPRLLTTIENTGLPLYWATCMAFSKTSAVARTYFSNMKQVAENYLYYATLFGFSTSLFRNDYVATIAMYLTCGFAAQHTLAFELPTLGFNSYLLGIDPTKKKLLIEQNDPVDPTQVTQLTLPMQDVHVLNKKQTIEKLNNGELVYHHADNVNTPPNRPTTSV